MSEFVADTVRVGEAHGNDAAASAISLFPQGYSVSELRSDVALPNLSFSSHSDRSVSSGSASGNNDTGLVTIGDYLFLDSGKAQSRAAGVRRMASRGSRAGQRVDSVDALGIEALLGGRKAGCDAGKGAFEPTAGSLAGRNASADRKSAWVEAKETE